jgi:hypothetical protein
MNGIPESWSLPWHALQRSVAAQCSVAPAGSWLARVRSTNCHLQSAGSNVRHTTGAAPDERFPSG